MPLLMIMKNYQIYKSVTVVGKASSQIIKSVELTVANYTNNAWQMLMNRYENNNIN